MTLTELFTDIADAIRAKDGTTDTICANTFPQRILNLGGGGGGVNLPSNIHTGTFTIAQDTSDDILIEHGLSKQPVYVFVFAENPADVIGVIQYAFLSAVSYTTYAMITGFDKKGTTKTNTFSVNITESNFSINALQTTYKFRTGITYRWIAVA